ncbi:ATP-dependent helicase HrpB [Leucobacter sp. HY1908]
MTALPFDLARIGHGLVVSRAQQELERAAAARAFVVTAPPGTGKTTFVPPLVANLIAQAASADTGPIPRVILTQPRRIAARAAAHRLAELSGTPLGELVGVTMRGERHVSASTRVEVVTPGVLLRRLIDNPELPGVAAVVLDEVHERTVEGDLLLGMAAEARALRDDLIVVAMSATLDAASVSELLGGAPVVQVPSVLHPLTVTHEPFAGLRLDQRGVTRDYLAHLAHVTLKAQRDAHAHDPAHSDALVFVPGAREVDDLVALLRSSSGSGATSPEILPLHGRVPAREQDRAVRGRGPADPPRIIVSTSLAESSLTVPGVRLVVDAGLAREVRRDRGRDMAGLTTVSASRASAEQRAGRAARQGPGRVVRAYSEAEYAHMRQAGQPEIASADLTDAALLLAAWGTPEAAGLALLTPPPEAAIRQAARTLRALDLIDDAGYTTAAGRAVALLPIGARSARALTEGARAVHDPRLAAEVVAAVSDDHRDPHADLTQLLRALRAGRHPGAPRWKREVQRLERIARAGGSSTRGSNAAAAHTEGSGAPTTARSGAHDFAPGTIVALGRPEWVARRTSEHARSYLLASGTRAALPEGSELAAHEWLAVHEVQLTGGRAADGTGAVIRLAAPLGEEVAVEVAHRLVAASRAATIEAGKLRVREERTLGAIVLASSPVRAEPSDIGPAYTAYVRTEGLEALSFSDGASALRARLALLHRVLGAPWPDVSSDALLTRLDDWLVPDLSKLRPGAALAGLDLAQALRRLLPWPEAARLDELVPEHLVVPSGSRVRITYDLDDARPVVAVKLQELFGLAESPRLIDGRVPVLFHLLSPARRPLAVTDDLRSFWDGPYQQVRREMRGRYPKHPWPEDPWTARATARTKRAG